MLQMPIKPKGNWIMNDEGLKIYDGIGVLIKQETDIENANQLGVILFDDFQYNSEGTNSILESDELKEKMEQEWDHYNSHCTKCEKELPKRFYQYENMNLCTRCYNKKDTWLNNKLKVK